MNREAYLSPQAGIAPVVPPPDPAGSPTPALRVLFRTDDEAPDPAGGVIDLPRGNGEADEETGNAPVTSYRFTVDPAKAQACDEAAFLEARRAWASARARSRPPGTPWFRHLAGDDDDATRPLGDLDRSFAVFSGGRAVAENLALDRELRLASGEGANAAMVPVAGIEGVTVDAIDWKARLADGEIAVDALARFIPHDQHALFSPMLPTLLDLLERIEKESMPVIQSIDARNPYRGLVARYRRQLGLDFPDATTRLLPVKTVAVTGGDPFFPTGTDVAVIFETDRPDVLFEMLDKAIRLRTGIGGSGSAVGDGRLRSFVEPGRRISSHLFQIGGLVAVSNSEAQVRRLSEVVRGEATALGATDEYRFFRQRYPLTESGSESAFAFLSDATIRRWAGPEVRIAASRRNRALAALDELACRRISGREDGSDFGALLGKVTTGVGGSVMSERFGTPGFLTPISELRTTEATPAEKEAYLRWKRGYENGWSQVFDPIAARLSVSDKTKDYSLDLTVLPLTVDSDYREFMRFAGGNRIPEAMQVRPPGSLFHLALALDPAGPLFEEFNQELSPLFPELKIQPLSWVGDSISLELHRSLFWEAQAGDPFGRVRMLTQVPVSLRIASKSPIKLGIFLTALRAMVESSAPGTVQWRTREHGGQPYVVVSSSEPGLEEDLRICYATLPAALLVSLNERPLWKAIDLERRMPEAPAEAALPAGRSVVLETEPAMLASIGSLFGDAGLETRRRDQAWAAIPILNEWRRRFPDRDPVALHEARFGVTIACPGGLGYRWNEEALTMESVAYGHPSGPRPPAERPGFFARFGRLRSAIDFEDDGLRLRLHAGPGVAVAELPDPVPGRKLADVADLVPLDPGRILHYRGHDDEGEHTWSWSVKDIERDADGIRYVTDEPYESGGEKSRYFGRSRLGPGGEVLLGWQDGKASADYAAGGVQLPAELREGAVHRSTSRWTARYPGEDEEDSLSDEEGRSEVEIWVLGPETVEVPAGTFEDCVVVEVSEEGIEGGVYYSDRRKRWYHPGTGLVKVVDLNDFDPTMQLERIEEVAK